MTTVAELIEILKNYPQDATVRCVEEVTKSYGTCCDWKTLDKNLDIVLWGNDKKFVDIGGI